MRYLSWDTLHLIELVSLHAAWLCCLRSAATTCIQHSTIQRYFLKEQTLHNRSLFGSQLQRYLAL